MAEKLRAGILGVSGAAGQQFLAALDGHPQFEVAHVYGQSSAGKRLGEINRYVEFNPELLEMKIGEPKVDSDLDLVFSALPSEPARELEAMFAQEMPVLSVSSAYRYDEDCPILIPEVNEQHAEIIQWQQMNRKWKGFIVPGPNCTVVPAAITLKALHHFGIKKVFYTSYQAVSGAGIGALDKLILQESDPDAKEAKEGVMYAHNVIPYIKGEEEKVRKELKKILGDFGEKITPYSINVDGTCVRVPVKKGHTLVINVETEKSIDKKRAISAFNGFNGYCSELFGNLHSSPKNTVTVRQKQDRPQPYFDAALDGGMTTVVGRIRRSDIFENGLQYVALSNNLMKGAAKGAVQVAEFLLRDGYLD